MVTWAGAALLKPEAHNRDHDTRLKPSIYPGQSVECPLGCQWPAEWLLFCTHLAFHSLVHHTVPSTNPPTYWQGRAQDLWRPRDAAWEDSRAPVSRECAVTRGCPCHSSLRLACEERVEALAFVWGRPSAFPIQRGNEYANGHHCIDHCAMGGGGACHCSGVGL
ncbi:hypothetical protein BD779DRAFT_317538 [Infundibulicybe gibba]|nr:hypothetical protein BD779DRAFT_317538 [Infundibulicybe gibba]